MRSPLAWWRRLNRIVNGAIITVELPLDGTPVHIGNVTVSAARAADGRVSLLLLTGGGGSGGGAATGGTRAGAPQPWEET